MSKKAVLPEQPENHLVVFQEKSIRRTWHNEEWWFAIVDVVAVLTNSVQPEGYVKDLRRRDKELKGWGQIATPPSHRDGRRCAAGQLRQHRRFIPHHPVLPLTQGRTFQTLAGVGGLRAGEGN